MLKAQKYVIDAYRLLNSLDLAVFKICVLFTAMDCFQLNRSGNNVIKTMAFELSLEER